MFDKLSIGLDHAPKIFDLRGKILGQAGCNLEYIRNETGVAVILKGAMTDTSEPLYFTFLHNDIDKIKAAKNLAQNLIHSIREELDDFFKNNPPGPLLNFLPKEQPNDTQNILTLPNHVPPHLSNGIVDAAPTPHTIQQSTTIVTLQPQAQLLQVIPNQQIFVAQDGTKYIQVNIMPNPVPVAQIISPGQLVVPQNVAMLSVPQINIGQVQSSLPIVAQNNITMSQVPVSTSCNVASTQIEPIGTTVIPTPVQWSTEKHDTSEVKYSTQMQIDNMQWTAELNSRTTLVQNEQLAYTSQVAASNVLQLLRPHENMIPWIKPKSEPPTSQIINHEQTSYESQTIAQYKPSAGSEFYNDIIPGAVATNSVVTNPLSEDKPDMGKNCSDHSINVNDITNISQRSDTHDRTLETLPSFYNNNVIKPSRQQRRKMWYSKRSCKERQNNFRNGNNPNFNRKPFFKHNVYRRNLEQNLSKKTNKAEEIAEPVNSHIHFGLNQQCSSLIYAQTSTEVSHPITNQRNEHQVQNKICNGIQNVNITQELKEHPWHRQKESFVPWQTVQDLHSQKTL